MIVTNVTSKLQDRIVLQFIFKPNMKVSSFHAVCVIISLQDQIIWLVMYYLYMKVSDITVISVTAIFHRKLV